MAASADVYFYKLGERMGIDTLATYGQRFGFGGHQLGRSPADPEPAFGDLVHGWLTRPDRRRTPFGLHALGTLVGCAPIALPRLFVRNSRMTRLGRVTAWSAVVVSSAVLVLRNVLQGYYE